MQKHDLIEVRDLKKYFPIQRGGLQKTTGYIKAVDGVSFTIRRGETLGLVGESGCGKSTLGRCLIRLYEPTGGEVLFQLPDNQVVNVTSLKRRELQAFRRNMQIIFQDPYSSLNPRMTLLELIGEPLYVNHIARGKDLEMRVLEVLDQVGLNLEHLRRYPHSFSGGQRQRIGIARALVLKPKLIVADEPVSALDVSIQAQILNLLKDLQSNLDLTYLFISHDLSVVRYVADRIAVMYVGRIVEVAPKDDVLSTPAHPYTEALLSAIPKGDPKQQIDRVVLPGEPPDPADLPSGCVFHQRCRYAKDICSVEVPVLREIRPNHHASCHFAEELTLNGVAQ